MIVDLLRNDMNRISEVGSEHVERLCQVEQYSTVWQMTSTIKSQLRPDVDLVEIFRSLFPCGSYYRSSQDSDYGNYQGLGTTS